MGNKKSETNDNPYLKQREPAYDHDVMAAELNVIAEFDPAVISDILDVVDDWVSENTISLTRSEDRKNANLILTKTIRKKAVNPKEPLMFTMSGRSGTGKSEFTTAIAETYFGHPLGFGVASSEVSNEPKKKMKIKSVPKALFKEEEKEQAPQVITTKTYHFSINEEGAFIDLDKHVEDPYEKEREEFDENIEKESKSVFDDVNRHEVSIPEIFRRVAFAATGEDCKAPATDLESYAGIMSCKEDTDRLANKIGRYLLDKTTLGTGSENNEVASQIKAVLLGQERLRRLKAFKAFSKAIDPEVKKIMDDLGSYDLKTLNHFHAGGDEIKRRNRIQAVRSYPLLTSLLVGDSKSGDLRVNDRVMFSTIANDNDRPSTSKYMKEAANSKAASREEALEAVDNGGSLSKFLQEYSIANHMTFSKRLLRSVGKIKNFPNDILSVNKHRGKSSFIQLKFEALNEVSLINDLCFLEAFDSNWHPKTQEELMEYYESVKRASSYSNIMKVDVEDVLSVSKGDWASFNEKTVSVQEVADIRDWFKAFETDVLMPAALNVFKEMKEDSNFAEVDTRKEQMLLNVLTNAAAKEFSDKHSIYEVLECSKRWHEEEHRQAYLAGKAALSVEDKDNFTHNWLPLSGPFKANNGITIKPLTTKAELEYAGEKLTHCVGGYWTDCMFEKSHIVGLYNEEGRLLTTAQINERRQSNSEDITLCSIQHQGLGRRLPVEIEMHALEQYLSELNEDENKPDFKAIEEHRAKCKLKRYEKGLASKIGFDPEKRENRALAFENFASYLPSGFRHMKYEAFLSHPMMEKMETIDDPNSLSIDAQSGLVHSAPRIEMAADQFNNNILVFDEIERGDEVGAALRARQRMLLELM